MADYNTFCKLVHTSKYLDMNGFLMVMPSDIHPDRAHLDMMSSNILLSDKAFMGSSQDRTKARDSLHMASILFGGEENIMNRPVIPSKVNPVSPFLYSEEMAGALIEYARLGQPLEFPDMTLAGTSAPITLAGYYGCHRNRGACRRCTYPVDQPGNPLCNRRLFLCHRHENRCWTWDWVVPKPSRLP